MTTKKKKKTKKTSVAKKQDDDVLDRKEFLQGWGFSDNVCHCCGKKNSQIGGYLMQCGKCKAATYCSMKCFNKHITEHQKFCQTNVLTREPMRRAGGLPSAARQQDQSETRTSTRTERIKTKPKAKTATSAKSCKPEPLDESTSEEEESTISVDETGEFTSEEEQSTTGGSTSKEEELTSLDEEESMSEEEKSTSVHQEEFTSEKHTSGYEDKKSEIHQNYSNIAEPELHDESTSEEHMELTSVHEKSPHSVQEKNEPTVGIRSDNNETTEEGEMAIGGERMVRCHQDTVREQKSLSFTKQDLPETTTSTNNSKVSLRRVDQTSKQFGWEKPDWAKATNLRKTNSGNLIALQTSHQTSNIPGNVEEDSESDHLRRADQINKQYGWKKPDWAKGTNLRKTNSGSLVALQAFRQAGKDPGTAQVQQESGREHDGMSNGESLEVTKQVDDQMPENSVGAETHSSNTGEQVPSSEEDPGKHGDRRKNFYTPGSIASKKDHYMRHAKVSNRTTYGWEKPDWARGSVPLRRTGSIRADVDRVAQRPTRSRSYIVERPTKEQNPGSIAQRELLVKCATNMCHGDSEEPDSSSTKYGWEKPDWANGVVVLRKTEKGKGPTRRGIARSKTS